MPRVARIYVPLSASFFMDDKVLSAGQDAAWLYLRMLAAVKSLDSDGKLTVRQVESLGLDDWRARLDALVRADLVSAAPKPLAWHDDNVLTIPGWFNWNDSSAERLARRERDRERKHQASQRRKKPPTTS